MENRLPSSFKVCATCALWAGSRSTDAFGSYSVFEHMKQVLDACDRQKAGQTVSPYGLTLMKVEYN